MVLAAAGRGRGRPLPDLRLRAPTSRRPTSKLCDDEPRACAHRRSCAPVAHARHADDRGGRPLPQGKPTSQLVKTLVFETENGLVAVLVRGDREANEVKLTNHLGVAAPGARQRGRRFETATGAPVGFAGPVGSKASRVRRRRVAARPAPTWSSARNKADAHSPASTGAGTRPLRAGARPHAGRRRRPLPALRRHARDLPRHRGRPHLQARHEVLRGDGLRLPRRGGRATSR